LAGSDLERLAGEQISAQRHTGRIMETADW
jgi:hypothetical protein